MINSSDKTIIIIEDEKIVRDSISSTLEPEGYKVEGFENGSDALKWLDEGGKPSLLVLDLMMPGMDGLEICKNLRANGFIIPIIMLTAKSGEFDRILGLEIGADDYLTKPFVPRELVARVKALLRRMDRFNLNSQVQIEASGESDTNEKFAFSDVELDFQKYQAFKAGVEVQLSIKEFEIIKFLVSKKNEPVSRDDLLDEVWGYNSYPNTRTVDNFIARIRNKLETSPSTPKHILTVHGLGYKFISD